MNAGSLTNTGGSDGRLAKVSYLPGVIPPAAPAVLEEAAEPAVLKEAAEPAVLEEAARPAELNRTPPTAVAFEEPVEDEPETEGERSARAHNVSMHALTRRGMSSAEMTALLRSRDLASADVEFEVSRLEEVGLLDDRELASNLVRTLQDRKGLGRSAITAELRRRKVDSVAIEEALSELDGDDELTRAREIAMKRAPQLRSLDAETARRRLGAFLMRKGYSGSVVSSAVASALSTNALGSNAPTTRGPRFQ